MHLAVRAVILVVIAALLVASPAQAHLRSGTVAVDYRASVLRPDTDAYRAQIYQSDRALGLTVRPGHTLELLGYLREPVFRLDNAGLWINAASPSAVVFKLVKRSQHVLGNTPHWRLERGRASVVWQDARAQGLPPGVDVGIWRVPLVVDGARVQLSGVLRRFGAPALWPWIAGLLALLAAGAAPVMLRRRGLLPRASIAFGVTGAVASLLVVISFSLDAYASPGTWIEALDAIAFLMVGLWVLVRAPTRFHLAAAIGLGVVAVAVGLIDGAVFFHPIVLAVLPAGTVRALTVLALGAGSDAAALGALEML
jgi:hypothetical protein